MIDLNDEKALSHKTLLDYYGRELSRCATAGQG